MAENYDLTRLLRGYSLKKGDITTHILPVDQSAGSDLTFVILECVGASGSDVTYNGYGVEVKLDDQKDREKLKEALLDAVNYRDDRYVKLGDRSSFELRASFVKKSESGEHEFYSAATSNLDLAPTSASAMQGLASQVSAISKMCHLKITENEGMRAEIQVLKNLLEEVVTSKAAFKEESLRAFTLTMNEQKKKFREVLEENEKLTEEVQKLRAEVVDAKLKA